MIRKSVMTTQARFGAALAGAAVLAAAANADDITLRASVRLPLNADAIRLGHIADLEGDEAIRRGELVIHPLDKAGSTIELSVREVRLKLDQAGVNWGKVNLSGGKVIVRPARGGGVAGAGAAEPPLAMTPVAIAGDRVEAANSDEALLAADLMRESTLRGAIAGYLAATLALEPPRLRLMFSAGDAELLGTDLSSTRFELLPRSSLDSDQVALEIRTWEDGRPAPPHALTVRPATLVKAAVLRRDLARGEVVNEADLECAERWLPLGQAASASGYVSAVGAIAARNLKRGDLLRQRDVRREALVKRGDLVMVRCLVGSVAISLQAEARADGAEGELIECRKQGERETFLAAVTGRGEAVVDLGTK